MSLLTPATLEACYEFLRATPPFKRWRLPSGARVKFKVTHHKDRFGHCDYEAGQHSISVSTGWIGRTQSLIETMAHEMIHVHLDRNGVRAEHGADFKRCAALVCRHHGFDEKVF